MPLVCSSALRVAWHNKKHITICNIDGVSCMYVCVGARARVLARVRACVRVCAWRTWPCVCSRVYIYDTYVLDNSLKLVFARRGRRQTF